MQRRAFASLVAGALGAGLALLASCQGSGSEPAPAAARETQLVVFAATSLRDAFTAMVAVFEKAHPGVRVTLNFAGTQEIRTQLEQGAVADVFASADERHMKALQDANRVEQPEIFAENEAVLVVSSERAESVRSLADLPSAARIVLGAPEVPIGRYALQILDRASAKGGADFRARVEARVVSRELNVRQVLAKVSLGEADAGIVYRSDVASAGTQYAVVTIPADVNVIARYPIAQVKAGRSPSLGREWVTLVGSEQGRAILRGCGFMAPPRAQATP
jgi:molybdate transport system substrate-binding protein